MQNCCAERRAPTPTSWALVRFNYFSHFFCACRYDLNFMPSIYVLRAHKKAFNISLVAHCLADIHEHLIYAKHARMCVCALMVRRSHMEIMQLCRVNALYTIGGLANTCKWCTCKISRFVCGSSAFGMLEANQSEANI